MASTKNVTSKSSTPKNKKSSTPKNLSASSEMQSDINKDLAQTYQMKSDKQHVLDNPDTYTGSMDLTDYDTFIYDEETNMISAKQITIIPGLYKLFDEGVVNCRDHCVRMAQAATAGKTDVLPVTSIQIDITPDGTITMTNDGNGIDVAKHPEEDIWIPEMIFGHLRTSTNYDKEQKKITGGKNGFGFKLVLIWSTWGKVETIDHIRGLKYVQEFTDNLNTIHPPKISKCTTKKPYTTVSFKPDYKRLGLAEGLSAEMLSLFKRRVYDVAAITDKTVKVKYNGELVPIKQFQQYVDLYIGGKVDTPRIYEEANERWEYVVCLAPKEEFTQVSFVNGIYTGKGGKHVDYILNQIIRKVTAFIKLKKKVDVKPNTIKEQLWLFVRCDIDNPAFESQTKDYMNTPVAAFGSSCEVSDKFIEKIAKMGVMDAACALTEVKENKVLKKNDGTKTKSVRGIPKYVGANYAGTDKSGECTLILCEGDSAKAGIMSGLSTSDRNIIGVYPLKGKLFNVRGEASKRIMENKEIHELKQILGLEAGKKYTPETVTKLLRYSKVLFMTDQDLDGSHIKGLGINLIDSEWDTLLSIPGFIGFMNTPIIKAQKGNKELLFYSDGEYEKWKQDQQQAGAPASGGWKCKYYKGLGTSTSKEFKEYFANKKTVEFISTGANSRDAIDMAFNKKRANDRKEWLTAYNRHNYLDTSKKNVSYEEFITQEMIHFSKYDCERSIPNIDGLKTSQRKVLYTCFKRRLTSEIKVAQLSGSVSEMSRYHHGEQSLNGTIVNMAQNFVGSNNINLLEPNGQFGTRLQGGDDSASERYIFTQLNPMTRYIFPEEDDAILSYLEDDGYPVEPVFYVPIVPILLINGSKGIGTGFSTDILCYNPLTIIEYMTRKIKEEDTSDIKLIPYYEGFKGTITSLTDNKYLIRGKYEIISDKQVRIVELPVGTWTEDYKQFIEDLIEGEKTSKKSNSKEGAKEGAKEGSDKDDKKKKPACGIKDYTDMSTDTIVDITLTFAAGIITKLVAEEADHGCNGLEKLLKLYTTRSTTNMHAFDENEKLVKFDTVEDLCTHYMKIRFDFYVKRKAYQLVSLEQAAKVLSNKARFIGELLDSSLDLRKKKTSVVSALLKERLYDVIDGDEDYKYLVRLPMDSVTEENVLKINQERDKKLSELDTLKKTTETQLWLNELETLHTEYNKYIDTTRQTSDIVVKKKVKVSKK